MYRSGEQQMAQRDIRLAWIRKRQGLWEPVRVADLGVQRQLLLVRELPLLVVPLPNNVASADHQEDARTLGAQVMLPGLGEFVPIDAGCRW